MLEPADLPVITGPAGAAARRTHGEILRVLLGKEPGRTEAAEYAPPPATTRRRSWAQLLRQVFEVEVLLCPKCETEMKIISFITTSQDQVLRRILEHLGVSTVVPRAHGPPEWLASREQEERAVPSRDEESFSQAPPGWDEWEPA